MALELFTPQYRRPGLLGLEKIMLFYWTFTTALLFILFGNVTDPWKMLISRVLILVGLAAFMAIYRAFPSRFTFLLRHVYQLGLLAFWYTDTYNFNQLFPNLDHFFVRIEQALWGTQPALHFCQNFSGLFWSEAFNLGYFSYYPMIIFVLLLTFFWKYHRFEKTAFIILTSFFCFYLIYLFLPVAGPQYYFQAIGVPDIVHEHFRPLGDYFRYHTDLLPSPDTHGLFYNLVEATQLSGERPTAAFPSSHVGVSTILMILARKCSHKLFYCLIPFYLLLCISTVYIQAHYLIDSIAGFALAFPIYHLCHYLYYTRLFHRR